MNKITCSSALQEAKQLLATITDQPLLEATILLAFILHKPRSYLYAHPEIDIDSSTVQQFKQCMERRLQGEPVAYITGKKEFWTFELTVTPATLIPRPETELLVEWVLRQFPAEAQIQIADLGTGSGAIALALASERPHWKIYATDNSASALQVAKDNAANLNIKNIIFCQGNWCEALPVEMRNKFNCIVSNPPYIAEAEWPAFSKQLAFEPVQALASGNDGLDAIRLLIPQASTYLCYEGWLVVEHGYLQANKVRDLLTRAGYRSVNSIADLAGHERITFGCVL